MPALLDLSPDELLSTTRAVRRRLDLDRPVDPVPIREFLEIAAQAPTASNGQNWHFVVVTDAAKRARLGELYRQAFELFYGEGALIPVAQTKGTDVEPGPRRDLDGIVHLEGW